MFLFLRYLSAFFWYTRKHQRLVSMCDRLIMILNGIGCIWLVKSGLFLHWISSIGITDITFYLN